MTPKLKLPKIEFSAPKQLYFAITRVFSLLWRIDKRLSLLLFGLNIIDGLITLPMIYLEKLILDRLVANIGNPAWQAAIQFILLATLGRLTLQIVQDLTRRFNGVYGNLLGRKYSDNLEIILGEKYAQLDLAIIEDPGFKDRYNKIDRESRGRAWTLITTLFAIPNALSGIFSSAVILYFFQPLLALLVIGFLVPQFVVDARSVKREYQIESDLTTKQRIGGWLNYYLIRPRGYMEVRLLNLTKYLSQKLAAIQKEIFQTREKTRVQKHKALAIANLPQYVLYAGLSVYFAFLVIVQRITLGSSEAYIRALGNFRTNLTDLMRSFVTVFENYLYISDLMWFLDLKPIISGQKGVRLPKTLQKGIVFEDVWFRYTDKSPWIIKGVSFSIQPKENLALIGDNGAGKTTLIKLLVRFYDPTKGRILLDGRDLREYRRDEYWQKLAVLFQEFESYPFTARESIGYGDVDQVDNVAKIREKARMTDIDSFIMDLPKHYENPLSREFEGGVSPSFGQAQRMGIARALMKDSNILVLDEPTSNVDPKTEEEIFKKVLRLGKNKILIFISHRFSTVRRADRILVLSGGKITEHGTHTELMLAGGVYSKLFKLQAKSYQ